MDGTLTVVRPVAGGVVNKSVLSKPADKATLPVANARLATDAPPVTPTQALDSYWSLEGQKQETPTAMADPIPSDVDWEALAWGLQGSKKSLPSN